MNKITLKCFHCGVEKEVYFEGNLTWAFQLAQLANEAGMLGVVDNVHQRSVVFCNENCLESEKTKKGTIRVKPLGIKCG